MDKEKFIKDRITEKSFRLMEVEKLLQDPDILKEREKFISLSKEEKELRKVVNLAEEYKRLTEEIGDARELVSSDDEEFRKLAEEEIGLLVNQKNNFAGQIITMLAPSDIDSEKNVILEIRAGTGGEEASLFAGDLYRMYSKYAETKSWVVEPIIARGTQIGGFKEIVSIIKGEKVYGKLRFEMGVHRVQRVPTTESSGRIHTSTCTVAVLPEAKKTDIEIAQKDLKIDFFRSGGAGGQSVNKLSTAVRISHIPTGITVECQDERSQYKNRQRAMQILLARIYDLKRREEERKRRDERRSQIGTGDRSFKIRTYNFRENRVTDHRINLTLYRLENVLNGDIDMLIDELTLADISVVSSE
ncbi:peptide chain release factor 1 [candidate division WOR-3 bacterium]|nr:peptide chain release factor 1 [candidate division WOR-3 bacterium]